jgi:CheY-like chemotaxis protein
MAVSILVVDDEPDVAELFRRRFRRELRNQAYVFHFAASGEEALRLLRQGIEPELMLILSDINMPGMNGMELLRTVKRLKPELPVAMITAYGDPDSRQRAIDDGAIDFLTKPIDFHLLKVRMPQLINSAGHV